MGESMGGFRLGTSPDGQCHRGRYATKTAVEELYASGTKAAILIIYIRSRSVDTTRIAVMLRKHGRLYRHPRRRA